MDLFNDLITIFFILIGIISLIFFIHVYKEYPSIKHVRLIIMGISLLLLYSVLLFIPEYLSMNLQTEIIIIMELVKVLGNTCLIVGILLALKHLIRIINTDFLTNVYTKRYLERRLLKEKRYFSKTKSKFSILFLDVNNFKQVNDKFGHEKGDKVLAELASTIKASLRKQDIVGRYGGDEFMVLLSGTDKFQSEQILNRIQEKIISNGFYKEYNISISGGIATFPDDGQQLNILAEVADKRMFYQKSILKEELH